MSWGRFARLKAVLQHGRSQMTETSKRVIGASTFDKPEEKNRRSSTLGSSSILSPSKVTSPSTSSFSSSSSLSSTPPPPPPPLPKAVISPSRTFTGDTRDDKKTLLANIRGKLHKKWEELSGESGSSPENENEKCPSPLRKQNSDESCESQSPKINSKSAVVDSINMSQEIEQGEELTEDIVPDSWDTDDDSGLSENLLVCKTSDGTSTIQLSPPARSSRMSIRERFRGSKMIKNIVDPVPIKMSNLQSKSNPEEFVDNDGRIYYDVEDEEKNQNPMVKDNDTVTEDSAVKNTAKSVCRDRTIPTQKLLIISVSLFIYLITPMPPYLAGVITGAAVTSIIWVAYFCFKNAYNSAKREDLSTKHNNASLSISQLPPLLVPEMKEPKLEDTIIYKGWMNELYYYDPDNYHINKTNSVYVRLEGVTLRLSTPKTNVPKRAMFDENLSNPTFINQRHYDLNSCRVFLLPAGLVKKRLWSKKYPICIDLTRNSACKSAPSLQKKPLKDNASSPSTDMGFEVISTELLNPTILYLFARTGREKEEWYNRFHAASLGLPLGNHIQDIHNALKVPPHHKRSDSDTNIGIADGFQRHRRHNSMDSMNSSAATTPVDSTASLSPMSENFQHTNMKKFSHYMAKLMPASLDGVKSNSGPLHSQRESSSVSASSTPSSPTSREVPSPDLPYTILDFSEPQLLWINALIGRCLWDFLQDKSWTDKVMEKLQKKLSKIHVPYFIEELKITDIDLGTSIPILQKSSKPYLDERGFWVDLQTMYTGGFKMTISTKVNLMKLKKKSLEKSPVLTSRRSAVTDSNEEDSAESSTDEEPEDNGIDESSGVPQIGSSGSGASRKILRYIDMITQSKYFQQATEYKYIKKAMEGVSNTPLILTVEVHCLNGVLTINVPPPPTDRLWYGFRDNPQLTLVAKPKVGEREVTVTHITEWIEKKLTIEFQRIFVLPNMDDLVIPLLLPGLPEDAVPSTICPPDGTEV
uniref:SMP-LTD domain-containing protein n=1 Tax=Octopus bimaculoides TaxID=37653 RepID=A0A0L8GX32_OCTBM